MPRARPQVPTALDAEDPDEALDITDLDTELLDLFLEESNDILDHSDGLLARLREHADDRESIVNLQRDLHTLKGGARMAGIYAVGDLGHAMESLLEVGRRRPPQARRRPASSCSSAASTACTAWSPASASARRSRCRPG